MRKIIVSVALLYSMLSFGQTYTTSYAADEQKRTYDISMGIGFSTEAILDMRLVYKPSELSIGLGGGVGFKNEGVGTPSEDFYFNWYDQRLYETTGNFKTGDIYVIGGCEVVKKLTLYTKTGVGFLAYAKNYFDPDRIFGENGYHYTKVSNGTKGLFGIGANYAFAKHVSGYVDLDSYSGVTFGMSYIF